ncbi:hypothetical protein CMI37_26620 [Candidatus Pacearchaeota archaeon]|nr:hypothetical protein [Candidatus Pacearchaeota archaeon]
MEAKLPDMQKALARITRVEDLRVLEGLEPDKHIIQVINMSVMVYRGKMNGHPYFIGEFHPVSETHRESIFDVVAKGSGIEFLNGGIIMINDCKIGVYTSGGFCDSLYGGISYDKKGFETRAKILDDLGV